MKQSSYRDQDYAFGQLILTLRSAIGLTQAGLAQILGVSRQSVAEWEAGSKYPKAKHLQAFIELAVKHQAFPIGREADEIRALWKASYQRVLLDEGWLAKLLTSQPAIAFAAHAPPTTNRSRFHWENALAVDSFYGREWELNLLKEWIIDERCRVVTLLGLGGIGKSALAINFMHQLADHFEIVIWRSLRDLPTCDVLLIDLLQVLVPQALVERAESFESRLQLLMEQLRITRILIVLDNVESVLEETQITGRIRPNYEGFGRFLKHSAETWHQSTILLTSRQKPHDLLPHEGNRAPVRALRLAALDSEACQQLLAERDVIGSSGDQTRLIEVYAGNPLALKIVAQTIFDLFGGEIAPFLEQGGTIFGGIHELLHQQYKRLSPLEKRIAFWLAIMRESVTFDQLRVLFAVPLPPTTTLETVNAMYRHSLIERGQVPGSFTLQSVVLEYLTEQLITETSEEISRGDFTILIQHGLEQAQVKDYVRHTQTRLLIAPLLLRLQNMAIPDLEAHLKALLDRLRDTPLEIQGYAPANLLVLLRILRGHLKELDLSRLVLRAVYLQGVDIQDTNLSGSQLRDCVFIETFAALNALSISQTGGYWAANSTYGQIWVWEAEGRILYRLWEAGSEAIQHTAISPDGSLLAGGYLGGSIKLWDTASGALLWSSEAAKEQGYINFVAFSPVGNIIATTGSDRFIRLWHTEQGSLLAAREVSTETIALAWRSDGALLATADMKGTIYFWSIGSDISLLLTQSISGHEQLINGLAFSPDGLRLASASWDGTVKVWDVIEGQLQETLTGHQTWVHRVAWSANGRVLASGGRNGAIFLWDVEGRYYRAVLRGHTGAIRGLAFTPDSKNLVSASLDATLRVWEVESGQSIHILHGYNNEVFRIFWSPDGSCLASSGLEPLVMIFSLDDAMPLRFLQGHTNGSYGLTWSPDGRWIASSDNANFIRLWDATTGAAVASLSHREDPDNVFIGLAWSPDGQYLAAGTAKHGVVCFDMKPGIHSYRTFQQAPPIEISFVLWSPDGTYLAGMGNDMKMNVWDSNGVLRHQLSANQHPLSEFTWNANGTQLVTLDISGEILTWDTTNWQSKRVGVDQPGYASLTWGADNDHIIIGCADGVLRWWDIQRGVCVMSLECHRDRVNSIKTSSDRTMLASCGEDGTIVVCDTRTGQLLKTLRRDRPYERLDITGIRGLTEAQKITLRQLGAFERDFV